MFNTTLNITGSKVVEVAEELERGDCYLVERDMIIMISDNTENTMILTGSRAGELVEREDYQPELIPQNKIKRMDIDLEFAK